MADTRSTSETAADQPTRKRFKRAAKGADEAHTRPDSDITSTSAAEAVARAYFAAIDAHDLDTAVALWAPGGREHVRGQIDGVAPDDVREFIGSLLRAVPDLRLEVVSTTAEGDRCAVQWRMRGAFAGDQGVRGREPNGAPILLEGVDIITARDGLIQSNDAFSDGLTFAEQVGLLPAQGSALERRMLGAFNAKTRLEHRLAGAGAEPVAEGVWVVQGQPARCNVYLLADGGGVTLFDAGARTMVRAVAGAAAQLGGVRRIVLGHGHTDHRGVANAFDVPILCHPDEVLDAEGSGGFRYWGEKLPGLPPPARPVHRMLHRYFWDGGPVRIAGTVSEGDEVAGFRVVHIPGHAPGLIALWRDSDRLALVSDAFYTLDFWGRDVEPRLPLAAYNYDTEQARASLRKLADLDPAAAWPGHALPALTDVRAKLLRGADAS
jgi:glyoxylase-like metal-dependent hydrolase (beta-lactamase superfamily II)